jgi:hypothetical protein
MSKKKDVIIFTTYVDKKSNHKFKVEVAEAEGQAVVFLTQVRKYTRKIK